MNVKVISSDWGYVLKWVGASPPDWITSEDKTFCWYKRKQDAEERAAIYN